MQLSLSLHEIPVELVLLGSPLDLVDGLIHLVTPRLGRTLVHD